MNQEQKSGAGIQKLMVSGQKPVLDAEDIVFSHGPSYRHKGLDDLAMQTHALNEFVNRQNSLGIYTLDRYLDEGSDFQSNVNSPIEPEPKKSIIWCSDAC